MLTGWSWDARSDQWEEGFSCLKEFSHREGHCQVTLRGKTADGYRLGQWIAVQRRTKDKMDLDRRQRLEALTGWSWDLRMDQWEEGFSRLKEFAERKGHCRVAASYKTDDGYRLGSWVNAQRSKKDKLKPDLRQRLEGLTGWLWNAWSGKWEEGFSLLKEFSEREGHCRVSFGYKTEDGHRLGEWVGNLRQKKETMDPDRRQRLEALTGWSWDLRMDQWEEGFSRLKEFAERKGHCRVAALYKTNDGYRLGSWVNKQRARKNTLDLDRRERLEALPSWSWAVRSDQWERASLI